MFAMENIAKPLVASHAVTIGNATRRAGVIEQTLRNGHVPEPADDWSSGAGLTF